MISSTHLLLIMKEEVVLLSKSLYLEAAQTLSKLLSCLSAAQSVQIFACVYDYQKDCLPPAMEFFTYGILPNQISFQEDQNLPSQIIVTDLFDFLIYNQIDFKWTLGCINFL